MNKTHLESLTWLRAVAAFFVVVSHSLRTAEGRYSANDVKSYFLPFNLLDLGSLGVCMFFALSGCTLYLSNAASLRKFSNIPGFLLKRFMRIWPAFLFSLIVYIIFIEVFKISYMGSKMQWVAQFLNSYTIINIFQYLTLAFNITGPRDLFIGPYWSLPLEFQYYVAMPFAVILMNNRVNAIVVPVIFGGALYVLYKYPVIPMDRNEVFQLGYTFFGGVLLANIYLNFEKRLSAIVGLSLFAALIFLAGLVVTEILLIPSSVIFISDKWNYYGVSAVACVALALFSAPPKLPTFLHSFFTKFGDISYSIYLFHMLFIGISVIVISRVGIHGNFQKLSFIFLFTMFFSYVFSILTYKFIEMPSINYGKELSEWIGKKNTLLHPVPGKGMIDK